MLEIRGFPRRSRLEYNTPEERAIRNVIHMVELLGADPRLTDVVITLGLALTKLADFVDDTY